MAFSLPSATRSSQSRPAWSGMAVLVEAMLLLTFLIASLAVVTQLFAASALRAREGERLAHAVSAATDVAERFAADPASVDELTQEGELAVACEVSETPTATGTLYDATITVFVADDAPGAAEAPLYVLTTSRYQREVG